MYAYNFGVEIRKQKHVHMFLFVLKFCYMFGLVAARYMGKNRKSQKRVLACFENALKMHSGRLESRDGECDLYTRRISAMFVFIYCALQRAYCLRF